MSGAADVPPLALGLAGAAGSLVVVTAAALVDVPGNAAGGDHHCHPNRHQHQRRAIVQHIDEISVEMIILDADLKESGDKNRIKDEN